MGWYASPITAERDGVLLWMMNEAELTDPEGPRIGYAQVGLESGVPLSRAMPALIQCFVDSVRRFGPLERSSVSLTLFGVLAHFNCLGFRSRLLT